MTEDTKMSPFLHKFAVACYVKLCWFLLSPMNNYRKEKSFDMTSHIETFTNWLPCEYALLLSQR